MVLIVAAVYMESLNTQTCFQEKPGNLIISEAKEYSVAQ